MTETNSAERAGLCAVCAKAEDCTYRLIRGCDALYCEQFEWSPEILEAIGGTVSAADDHAASPEEDKGLCANCGRRRGCSRAKANGGVWHCEDYC